MKKQVALLVFFIAMGSAAFASYQDVNLVLSLSGTGYLSVPNNTVLNSGLLQTGIMSIDAWVYPSKLGSVMAIVGNDYTKGYFFGILSGGNLCFYPRGGVFYTSPGAIAANQWSHVAVSYNSRKNTLVFYINGTINTTITTSSGYIGTSTTDLRIGADRYNANPDYYWNGMIDEVRIWNQEINFSTASGLLYRVPHAVVNGRYGKYLAAAWRLNGDGTDVVGASNGSAVGTVSYSGASLPPHYTRICAVMSNLPATTAPGTNDYFTVAQTTSLSLVQNYTLECWVKPASSGGGTTYQTFIAKGSEYLASRSYWLGLDKASGKVRFVANGLLTEALLSGAAIPVGQWTHVAARFSVAGSVRTASIFLNGVLSSTRSCSSVATVNKYAFIIGRDDLPSAPTSGDGFSGMIDEARVWNDARSDDEIADNYRIEISSSSSNLVANFHFDGDVLDQSGSGNDANPVLDANSDVYFNDASDLPSLPTVQVTIPNGGESWTIGSSETVHWTSSGLLNVQLQLSRDGGQTFPEIIASKTTAANGAFNFVVTGPATSQAVVRVTTPTPTTVHDESNSVFSIMEPPPAMDIKPLAFTFTAAQNGPMPNPQILRIANTGGQTLTWVAQKDASNWYDVVPGSGFSNVDSTFITITTTNLPEGSYSGVVTFTGNASNSGLTVNIRYVVTSKQVFSIAGTVKKDTAGIANLSVLISGDATMTVSTDANGSFNAPGLPQGNYIVTPLSSYYDFTPSNRSYSPLTSNVTNADFVANLKHGTMRIVYKQGWNLISLPLAPDSTSLSSLFPEAVGNAFLYNPDSGYVATQTLQFSEGYWIKFSKTDSVDVGGFFQPVMKAHLSSVYGGWNLIGTPSAAVDIATIDQQPSGSILLIYEYDPYLGYFFPLANMLRPGRAYFVKAASETDLTMTIPPSPDTSPSPPPPPLESLRFPGARILQPGW